MRATGCIRPIDRLGRLVLPSDIRKSLGIKDGEDSVEFFTDGDTVVIKKYRAACVFCNSYDNLVKHKGQNICQSCLDEIKNG